MIRFNCKGEYNVPFLSQAIKVWFTRAYVIKIVNQIDHIARILRTRHFRHFQMLGVCGDGQGVGKETDMICCDLPYIDRHVDYYNGWDDEREKS